MIHKLSEIHYTFNTTSVTLQHTLFVCFSEGLGYSATLVNVSSYGLVIYIY